MERKKKKIKVIVAIQARMGSKRLPNKALRKIGEQTVLEHVIERTLRSKEADQVVLATTSKPKDDVLVKIAKKWNIGHFRGSESDVLGRLYNTAKKFNADALFRITGDSPLTDPLLIDQLICEFRKRESKIAFATTCLPLTFPEGFTMEIISFETLTRLIKLLKKPEEREAFAIYLSKAKREFPRYNLRRDEDASNIRLSLDYPEDFTLINKIFDHFAKRDIKNFGLDDIVEFLTQNPRLLQINSHRIDRGKYPFSLDAEAVRKGI